MNETVNETVSVISVFNHLTNEVKPVKIQWRSRVYKVQKIGYHYKIHEGKTLYHVFTVVAETAAFKLKLDTDSLHWTLEEIYNDDNP